MIDYWSLEYCGDETIRQQLLCPICQTVLVEPYSTKCGHTFCRRCITSAQRTAAQMSLSSDSLVASSAASGSTSVSQLSSSSISTGTPIPFRCPIDRHPLTSDSDIRPAAFLVSSLVNDLIVKCPQSNLGCEFKDKRWLLKKHVESECGYVTVTCGGLLADGTTCPELIERRFLEKRLQTQCVHEELDCPNECGEILPLFKLDKHLYACDMQKKTVDSEFENEVDGIKNKSEYNVDEESKCVSVYCKAREFGCQWELHKDRGEDSNEEEEEYTRGQESYGDEQHAYNEELEQDEVHYTGQILTEEQQENRNRQVVDLSEEKNKHEAGCVFVALERTVSLQNDKMTRIEAENQTLKSEVERLTTVTNLYGIDEAEEQQDDRAKSRFNDADLLHMFMECERLRRDVDHLTTTSGEMYVKQGEMLMRENYRLAEEIAVLRSGFNSLRHQIHFLLSERRSWTSSSVQHHHHHQSAGASTSDHSDVFRDVKL